MDKKKCYVVDKAQRVDKFLTTQLQQSRSQISALIKKGAIEVDGSVVTKNGYALKDGQKITITFPILQISQSFDVNFDVEILYEDDDLMVVNKPSGVTTHPAPSVKEATLVDWLKQKGIRLSTISGEERHGIVHRLDKGTSGAMVIAKTNEAHQALSLQLQDKSMGRYYLAVITPPLKDDLVSIDLSIGRSPHNRLKMACGVAKAKDAKTMFKNLLVSHDEKFGLIACKLFSGRTHQIRVHLESFSRHIVGDHIYGGVPKQEKSERILLHAYLIYFIHPTTKEKLFFQASMDDKIKSFIDKNFDLEKINEIIQQDYIVSSFATID